MSEEIITIPQHETGVSLHIVGQIANFHAASNVFSDYQQRIAAQTSARQQDDLALFSVYLAQMHVFISPEALRTEASAWQDMTHGIVEGFVRWMLSEGYAIGTVNVRLSTIRTYCVLAAKAGIIPAETIALIRLVSGYRHKEGRNVDQLRPITRKGVKKADPVSITYDQAQQLKAQPDTPQGRRDALLLCLLLDHGLRCGEIAALPVQAINLTEGTIAFYRSKVDKTQTHELTGDTLRAAQRYFEVCTPEGTLLMGSHKGGQLVGAMKTRSITDRVRVLCARIGIEGASAHDGRHAWATFAIRGGTDLKSLQDAGGWNTLAMPARYAESQKIANKGVTLGK